MSGRRAVFLDRDGVINAITVRDGVPHPPDTLAEFVILPGVAEACTALHEAGWLLIVVTNQPDVARGVQTLDVIESMHAVARERLPLDDIVICPHDTADNCPCRKPRPGMLIASAVKWGIDLSLSYMVGDRSGDVLAGDSAGCTTIFIDGRQGGTLPDYGRRDQCRPDHSAPDLAAAAQVILRTHKKEPHTR